MLTKAGEIIAAFVVPVAAYFYFVGWIYLYSFLDYFQIDILSAGLSVNDVLMYSFVPIRYIFRAATAAPILVVLLCLLGIALVGRLLHPYRRFLTSWQVLVLGGGAVFLLSSWAASYVGSIRAAEHRRSGTTSVHFVMRETAANTQPAAFTTFNEQYLLRQIIETEDLYFAFYQKHDVDSATIRPGWVFKVPKENALVVESILREE